jgi:transposase
MAQKAARRWITDEVWEIMGPALIAARRSKAGKPPRQTDRDLMEALIWQARTGSPWRDLPPDFGGWHSTYTRFRRAEAAGTWKRFWEMLQDEALAESVILLIDSTSVRAHQHAAGAPKKTRSIRPWADRVAD